MTLFICSLAWPVTAQVPIVRTAATFQAATADLNSRMPAEKIFLHTDKRVYAAGDTLWFKAYVFQDDSLTSSQTSGILQLMLLNEATGQSERLQLPLRYGLGWGCMPLSGETLTPGQYTLYAYTNWLRNFDSSYFFHMPITILGTPSSSWYVQYNKAENNAPDAVLQFTNSSRKPLSFFNLQVSYSDGKKNTKATSMYTSENGNLLVPLPNDINKLPLIQVEDGSGLQVRIPLPDYRNTDLQFMPEGGDLVAGLPSKVGFKAIGYDGKGMPVHGIIQNSHGDSITTFKSQHNGMGYIYLLPVAGEKYSARVTWSDSATKTYALPAVRETGTCLQVKKNKTDLLVTVMNTRSNDNNAYLLTAQVQDRVYYAASLHFGADAISARIPQDSLPSGVVRISLLNDKWETVNERLVYVDHPASQSISIQNNKPFYHPGDSIAFELTYRDSAKAPVIGSFSAAITDDAQVASDTNGVNNISLYLQLQSVLKGNIEDPAWYFNKNNTDAPNALDNLLLTQGWSGSDWPALLAKGARPRFEPQQELSIAGHVDDRNDGPSPHTPVHLMGINPFFVRDTITDNLGYFLFNNLPPGDSTTYVLTARNKRDKERNTRIGVSMATTPTLPARGQYRQKPWNVDLDSIDQQYLQSSLHTFNKTEQVAFSGTMLKGVEIREKKVVKKSSNHNGPGEADQVLNEDDLKKESDVNLYDYLFKHVQGLKIATSEKGAGLMLYGRPTEIVIDGISLASVTDYEGGKSAMQTFADTKSMIAQFSGADVLGIEVMYTDRYTHKYDFYFTQDLTKYKEKSFIEITTRWQKGPYAKILTGAFSFHPAPVSLPRQYYRPRYTPTDTTGLANDLRATIHWEPNVMTAANGMAQFSFFAAGRPGTYTLILQGCDMNGHVISAQRQIVVK